MPEREQAEEQKTAEQPTATPEDADFIDTEAVLRRLPICRKTLHNWRRDNKIPYIQTGRRVIYHWPSVQSALLRLQRGGEECAR